MLLRPAILCGYLDCVRNKFLVLRPKHYTGNFHSQSGTEPCNPAVKISIQYTSKPLNRRLPSDYESIGKALSHARIYRGSKFAALIEKCAVIGLIKPIRFSRRSWGRKIAGRPKRASA